MGTITYLASRDWVLILWSSLQEEDHWLWQHEWNTLHVPFNWNVDHNEPVDLAKSSISAMTQRPKHLIKMVTNSLFLDPRWNLPCLGSLFSFAMSVCERGQRVVVLMIIVLKAMLSNIFITFNLYNCNTIHHIWLYGCVMYSLTCWECLSRNWRHHNQ